MTGHRTVSALLVLLLGLAALQLTQKRVVTLADTHSLRARALGIPSLGVGPGDTARLSKLELSLPASGESPAQHIVLEKRDAGWSIIAPLKGTADLVKVDALLQNLVQLKLDEQIDTGTGNYERYGLTDSTAFRLTVWRGPEQASELYFGKSSARGQLLRVAGVAGVFTVQSTGPGSFTGFLYTRPLRAWRERTILAFEPAAVVAVRIENRHGQFSFSKRDNHWCGSLSLRRSDGALGIEERSWARFDARRVEALLMAFKSLSADEFGRDDDRLGSGLDQAELSGGVIQIALDNPSRELVIRVGNAAHGPSEWAIQNSRWAMKVDGDGTLYALSEWTSDWLTNASSQFERQ